MSSSKITLRTLFNSLSFFNVKFNATCVSKLLLMSSDTNDSDTSCVASMLCSNAISIS